MTVIDREHESGEAGAVMGGDGLALIGSGVGNLGFALPSASGRRMLEA